MKKNIIIAFIILLVIFLWMLSGAIFNQESGKKQFKKISDIKIKVEQIDYQVFSPTVTVPAKIESEKSILISSQVSGNIDEIKVESGQFVKKDDLLVVIDGPPALSKLKQARINHKDASIQYKTDKQLFKKKLLSKSGFEKAKLKFANAKTDLENARKLYSKHYITAPFDGNVGIIRIKQDQSINIGGEIVDIENKSEFKVVAFVSIKHKNLINKKNKFSFIVDGNIYYGDITAISSTPEKIVKTYRVEGKIDNTNFVSGQPIKIKIRLHKTKAHFIPSSLFNIDEEGELAVKVLNNNNVVELRTVSIIEETTKGTWVKGLDDTTRLLTDGAGFAKIGEVIEN